MVCGPWEVRTKSPSCDMHGHRYIGILCVLGLTYSGVRVDFEALYGARKGPVDFHKGCTGP